MFEGEMPFKFYRESKIQRSDGQQVHQPSRVARGRGGNEFVFPLLSCEKSLADSPSVLGLALTMLIELLTS